MGNESVADGIVPEPALELLASAGKSRQNRAERRPRYCGNLAGLIAVDVREDHRDPIFRMKAAEHLDDSRVVEQRDEVEVDPIRVRERILLHDLVEEVEMRFVVEADHLPFSGLRTEPVVVAG